MDEINLKLPKPDVEDMLELWKLPCRKCRRSEKDHTAQTDNLFNLVKFCVYERDDFFKREYMGIFEQGEEVFLQAGRQMGKS